MLEAIFAYLLIAKKQYEDIKYADSYNVGPNEEDCVRTENVVKLFVANWKDGVEYECKKIEGPHEANFLRLDHSKIKNKLNWEPKWNIETAIKKTVELSKANTSDLNRMIETQISEYINKEIKRNV